MHCRAVLQALQSPVPPLRRAPILRPAPKAGQYRSEIDAWLLADRQAPRKQRHTASRIGQGLVDEHGADVAEVTVRQDVRARDELGWPVGDVLVPRVQALYEGKEVDWGETMVEFASTLGLICLADVFRYLQSGPL